MNRSRHTLPLCAAITIALGLGSVLPAAATPGDPKVEEFDEFEVFIEINATDGDAGLQGKLDGGPWRRAKVVGPGMRTVFQFRPDASLETQGVSEVAWESNEPPFDERPLEDFLALFPEGTYRARGTSLEGDRLESVTELTHDLPAGPTITHPGEEVVLDGENLVVAWDAVTDDYRGGPLGSDVVAYQVVVEYETEVDDEEITRVLVIDVAGDQLSAEVPAGFLEADGDYKIEVGAFEETGNSTFTEMEIDIVGPR